MPLKSSSAHSGQPWRGRAPPRRPIFPLLTQVPFGLPVSHGHAAGWLVPSGGR